MSSKLFLLHLLLILVLISLTLSRLGGSKDNLYKDDDTNYNKKDNLPIVNGHTFSEKIIKAGFEFEEHKIITEDRYILTAWRIPRRINEDRSIKHKPVIIQHGLLDDSWTWFALNATDCLPIILAEKGYDIWITNNRGNIFSTEHLDKEYDSNSFHSKYWEFSFHEMAKYDLPAHINFVKKVTGYEKIKYIGHSQGTLQFFLAYLFYPEFMEKSIEKFVSVGTVVSIIHTVK
jgi:pimeloyl-ACP methyl ester carboxylesterase